MNTNIIASLFDHLTVLAIATAATLYGFKVILNKSGNESYDKFYNSFGKHMKWMGPLVIAFQLLELLTTFMAQK